MSELIVASIFLAAFVVGAAKGPRAAFGWVYLATVILVPITINVELPGIPDVDARRAALLGLALSAVLTNRSARLIPRWRWLDLLPVAAALSFSISNAQLPWTGPGAFSHRLAVLGMDWFLPYVVARALLDNARHTRSVLLPLVISFTLLAFLAVYEARMGHRLAAEFWHRLAGTEVPNYWQEGAGYRWGFLRAFASTGHPILLGALFATGAPLAVLWGLLRNRSRAPAFSAAAACALGCLAALSRGPLLVLATCASLFTLIAYRVRNLIVLIAPLLILATPLAWDALHETVELTKQDLEETGGTGSARYRLAILLLYAHQDFGLWGNPSMVAAEYGRAWSIDNGYLFLFITGGWCGGTLFVAMVVCWTALGWRTLTRARGRRRKILSAALASFACLAGSMADAYFAPDYWPFFFVVGALVINQSRRAWFAAQVTPTKPRGRAPQEIAFAAPRNLQRYARG